MAQNNKNAFASMKAMLVDTPQTSDAGFAMTLDQIETIAQEANPTISVAVRRVVMAEAHVPAAGALNDPTFMYRGRGVPLRQPWNYNKAQNTPVHAGCY